MAARFKVRELLAEGRDTVVYRAERADGQRVILKVLRQEHPTPEQRARFRREHDLASLLAAEDVRGVVHSLELTEFEDRPAIVFRDSGGVVLSSLIGEGTRLEPSRSLPIAIGIAEAVQAVHAAGIVHKDIKPANIIVDPHDGGVSVIDFGIATLLQHESKRPSGASRVEGTLAYCSPEQTGRMNLPIDSRSDLYSLGATLYELLTGQRPFQATDALELVHSHIARTPPRPCAVRSSIPQILSDLVMVLLAKNPEDRYQTARGIASDLRRIEAGERGFALRSEDVSDRFAVPNRLFGRDDSLAELMSAFHRAASGSSEVLWVYGYSGVGKSALIREVHKPIVEQRGYFLDGKFDQFSRNVPYASLIQAFQGLVRQLLTESEERIAQWRVELLAALGDSAGVITAVVPQVELIIGAQPEAKQLSGDAASLRFRDLFLQFVRVFATAEHPLVVFLDDLQWADKPSLKILKGLVTDPDVAHLLFIGSYRDNEVPESHPVALARVEIRRERGDSGMSPESQLELKGLGRSDLAAMVADTTRRPASQVGELADLVGEKTLGNPFFVNQFLNTLHSRGLLTFDPAGRWIWDIAAVRAQGLTDNVVELMTDKVKLLDARCVRVLQLAAAVGNRFDLETLATVAGQGRGATANDLWPAIEVGLVQPLDDVYRLVGDLSTTEHEPISDAEIEADDDDEELNPGYRFLHDRVQQAAYSLIPEDEREGTHLSIARALAVAHADEKDLFAVANQYARSYSLITEAAEKGAVARLFHSAGERARLASAHEPAIKFFEAAEQLLDDPWGAQYELGWSVAFQRAASEYLGGDTDYAEQLTDELLGRCRAKLEKLQIYNLKVEIRAARSDFKDAVDVCREAVALTGISIPKDPGMPAMLAEVFKTQFIVRKTPPLEIADLPAATDPEMILTLRLLNTIAAAAFFVNANLGSIVLMKMTQTSYLHGNSPDSAFAWGCYCMVTGPILGNFEKALLYNESAKRIAAEYPDPGQMAKWPSSIAGLVQHWSHDQRSAVPMLLDGFSAGLEAGDPLHAHYVAAQLMNLRAVLGDNLDDVADAARTYLDHAARYQIVESAQTLQTHLWLAKALRGDTADVLFGESEEDERAFRERLEGFQMKLPFHAWLIYKALALLFMGRAAEARPLLVEAFTYDAAVAANPQHTQHYWLLALVDMATYDELEPRERKRALKRTRKTKKRIDVWAKTSPLGFTHKKLYIEAELARVAGDMEAATRLIDAAVEDAAENRYPHNEGWLNERAAAFHAGAGRRKVARVYLRAARAAYETWGASEVVRRLDAEHPGLALEVLTPRRGDTATVTTGARGGGAPSLDLQTVLRANEVVAREIVIDRLLDSLLHLAVENAGARRALLILDDGGELMVRAERLPETEQATLFEDRKVAGDAALSQAVVNLVARTRKASLVEDTAQPGQFTSCPYVRARSTRSILCVPLVHGDQLTGVMYLENELTTGAFTPERLELLRLLSSQIAISIQNAALYADSERMASAFARFVPQQFLTFLDKESILEIGLGDAVQRTMTVLFSDIRHFTSLSERMTPEENFAFLNEYLARVGPVIRKHDGFIDKYIGDAVMALFPNSPDDAVHAALDMQAAVADLNSERAIRGLDPIEIGVGLHHGSLMLGTIGEEERIDSTVISDAVNIASRLEGLTKTRDSSILISRSTVDLLVDKERFVVRSLGEVELRGREQTIDLHEVVEGVRRATSA